MRTSSVFWNRIAGQNAKLEPSLRPALLITGLLLSCAASPGDPVPPGSSGGQATTSGGATGTGGAQTSGGAPTSGGATSSGGSLSSGGTLSTGGSLSTGGTAPTSGGATTTGGIANGGTSGSNTSGGRAAGGNTTGGTSIGGSSTGGASTATGGSGGGATCPTANEDKFSFFLISNAELIRQGGADSTGMFSKYGGNLGGIEGADKICQTAAEHVSPCQKGKVWHAFLSTPTVNAIDRIGKGPWYDRNGRLWSANLTNLVGDRPSDADPAIKNDIPNENGVRNQNPDGTGNVDNHEIVTGTGTDGKVHKQGAGSSGGFGADACGADVGGNDSSWSVERATCWGWTRNTAEGCPRMGRSWCLNSSCTPPGSGSGTNWMSAWNAVGCEAGGTLAQTGAAPPGSRKIGAAGGYGGFYCFAVRP